MTDAGGLDVLNLELSGMDRFETRIEDFESRYMTKAEVRELGPQGVVSAGFVRAESPRMAEYALFDDPNFGKGSISRFPCSFIVFEEEKK